MDEKTIKEKFELAKKIVQGEKDPFMTEGFKIILQKLLDSEDISKSGFSSEPQNNQNADKSDPMVILANYIKIKKDDLMNVIHFQDNELILLKVKGVNTTEQNFYTAIIILTFWKIGKKVEFLSNVKLGHPMSRYGLSTKNLSTNLKKDEFKEYVVPKGKGKSKEYRITTKGVQKAIEIIKELSGVN